MTLLWKGIEWTVPYLSRTTPYDVVLHDRQYLERIRRQPSEGDCIRQVVHVQALMSVQNSGIRTLPFIFLPLSMHSDFGPIDPPNRWSSLWTEVYTLHFLWYLYHKSLYVLKSNRTQDNGLKVDISCILFICYGLWNIPVMRPSLNHSSVEANRMRCVTVQSSSFTTNLNKRWSIWTYALSSGYPSS